MMAYTLLAAALASNALAQLNDPGQVNVHLLNCTPGQDNCDDQSLSVAIGQQLDFDIIYANKLVVTAASGATDLLSSTTCTAYKSGLAGGQVRFSSASPYIAAENATFSVYAVECLTSGGQVTTTVTDTATSSSVTRTPPVNGTASGALPLTSSTESASRTTPLSITSLTVSTSAPTAATGAAGSLRVRLATLSVVAAGVAAFVLQRSSWMSLDLASAVEIWAFGSSCIQTDAVVDTISNLAICSSSVFRYDRTALSLQAAAMDPLQYACLLVLSYSK